MSITDWSKPLDGFTVPRGDVSGKAVVTLRLPCAIVESPRRHKRIPFVNIAFLRSRLMQRRQWKHKMDYYGVVFAHLDTGCGINVKDPEGLDSDRWIPHSRCCENPARAKALAGFSRHLSLYNTLRPRQNGRRFADDTFKRIFLNKNVRLSIKISLKFVPKGTINNIPTLVQIMAWRRTGNKPLSEPMMTQFNDAYMRHSASMS